MIYGYANKTVDEDGLLELRELTFASDSSSLRQIAEFLFAMADAIESGDLSGDGHRHIDEVIPGWRADYDIIAFAPPE